MNFYIKHEIRGRIRIHFNKNKFTAAQANMILYYIYDIDGVSHVKIYDRTADVVIEYNCDRKDILQAIQNFRFNDEAIKRLVPKTTNRELNIYYKEKLFNKFVARIIVGIFCPVAFRIAWICAKSLYYIGKGIKALWKNSYRQRIDSANAATVGISLLKGDFQTAFSVISLLDINKLLKDWTHKKDMDEADNKIDLNVDKVWCMSDGNVVLVPIADVKKGDLITIHMGNIIPIDGYVHSGEAMVNESPIIGKSRPVKKETHSYVYAGSMVEEGEIAIRVKKTVKKSQLEKISKNINRFKYNKSLDNNLELDVDLINKIVPYSLLGTLLAYAVTGNIIHMVSSLMLNLSCSLRFAPPMALLAAMDECDIHKISVKDGIFLEKMAKADTIVFDKTGTLTQANPIVTNIITFEKYERKEILRLAAAVEEHFPHIIANSIVKQSESENLYHNRLRVKIEIKSSEGIVSYVDNKRVIIGSRKFVLETHSSIIPYGEDSKIDCIKTYDSRDTTFLYMAIAGRLAAVILVVDRLRKDIPKLFDELRANGINRIVMMTGDSERTTKDIAKRIGINEYLSNMTPKAKAEWITKEKRLGNKIVMAGYGMSDAPALLMADVGIAFSEGAKINREIADIVVSADNLKQIVILKQISNSLVCKMQDNYRKILPATVIASPCFIEKIN